MNAQLDGMFTRGHLFWCLKVTLAHELGLGEDSRAPVGGWLGEWQAGGGGGAAGRCLGVSGTSGKSSAEASSGCCVDCDA